MVKGSGESRSWKILLLNDINTLSDKLFHKGHQSKARSVMNSRDRSL
jgi:hypothetical protein